MNKDGILNGRLVTDEDFLNTGATLETKAQNTSFTVSNIEQPEVAYAKVIAQAGASLHRDEIDNRLVSYVKSLGKEGKVIKAEAEVGGQIEFKNVSALKDTDGDGIPDSWESKHHLNPKKAPDANLVNKDGYTNLEEYLNELVAQK